MKKTKKLTAAIVLTAIVLFGVPQKKRAPAQEWFIKEVNCHHAKARF